MSTLDWFIEVGTKVLICVGITGAIVMVAIVTVVLVKYFIEEIS